MNYEFTLTLDSDAYKIVDLGRREKRGLGVLAATVLDRLLGLGGLTFLAVLFLGYASVAGIPLLRYLPLIGGLFQTRREQEIQRDLIILVTPHIVRTGL